MGITNQARSCIMEPGQVVKMWQLQALRVKGTVKINKKLLTVDRSCTRNSWYNLSLFGLQECTKTHKTSFYMCVCVFLEKCMIMVKKTASPVF